MSKGKHGKASTTTTTTTAASSASSATPSSAGVMNPIGLQASSFIGSGGGGGGKWHVIYPQYINSNLTVERGRRLPKSKCVPEPRWQEIFDVLKVNSAKFDVEAFPDKCYCREVDKENIAHRGYVKYRLKVSDDPALRTKRQVLTLVATLIPKLKSRQTMGKGGGGGASSNSGGGGSSSHGEQVSSSSSAGVASTSATSAGVAGTSKAQNPSSSGGGGGGGGGGNKKNKKKGRR